jgi:hypothetical protein
MSTFEVFKSIQSSEISKFMGSQDHLICASAQLVHIVGLLLVLSSIVLVSLRLLGLLDKLSLPRLAQATRWLIWSGLALLTLSGIFIFAPAATNYYPNTFFWAKFILLALAILLHVTLYRKVTQSDSPNPVASKITAILALTLWFSVAFAGRFIGFL